MATPLDQISRMGHVRQVDALEVDYYTADIRKDTSKVIGVSHVATLDDGFYKLRFKVEDPTLFEPTETIFINDGSNSNYTGYVSVRNDDSIEVICKLTEEDLDGCKSIVRMGRAATQLDVQSPQFSVLPHKRTNMCQIFKMQIEQSMVMKLCHKEIGWDFTDQQEAAIYDMRLGMEKQFLFGEKMKIFDPEKNENVTLTEGIWTQAGKEINVTIDKFDSNALVDLLRESFTGNSGSRKKILIAGSGLIAALNKIENQKVITALDQETIWGIDFNALQSKFGRLYVVFSEVFDVMGMPNNGIIVDPEYIQKHVFIPFRADRLDLRGSGQRNTEAMVLTEASCLTLRYPQAHARIVGV
jgi:acylphosphatase